MEYKREETFGQEIHVIMKDDDMKLSIKIIKTLL